MNLTVEAVSWDFRSATLKQHKTKKKGKQRILRFGDQSWSILCRQRDKYQSGFLFRNQSGIPFNAQTLAVKIGRACKRAGVKLTAYHFRHTWATRMLSKGKSETVVANALGHSGTRMIHQNYSHVGNNAALMQAVMNESEE